MIPVELTQVDSWISWRYEERGGKLTKIPYNPITGKGADCAKLGEGLAYDELFRNNPHLYSGAGFIITGTIYSFIDLDDPFKRADGTYITEANGAEWLDATSIWNSHWQIVQDFNSYTEWSPSGRGLHIIIKGKLPAGSRNRVGKVEIYSTDRYMAMTGKIVDGGPTEIFDRQGALDIFAEKLGLTAAGVHYEDQPVTQDDAALISAAGSGGTQELFRRLWSGDITGYPSGSEADQAFANLICYQTGNVEQAERIFRASPHYANRTKLHNRPDLVTRAVRKGMDKRVPPIDLSALKVATDYVRDQVPEHKTDKTYLNTRPGGLLGDIAGYVYQQAPRPVREIALAAAIGLMAGICGRAFNVSNTGLNQYVVLLAGSGMGKEALDDGITQLIDSVCGDVMPAARGFLGPSHIASAPSLYKHLGDGSQGGSPSFLSIIPEFGKWLKVHTSDRASAHQILLLNCFLDLYSKSGKHKIAGSHIYSDKDKNIKSVLSPAFSFVGETVPHRFFEAATADAIEGGLIPRFLIIEYDGLRVDHNPSGASAMPSTTLVQNLRGLCECALKANQRNIPTDVQLSHDALDFLDDFGKFCDEQHRKNSNEVSRQIWNRAHLKALKLAALAAVGCNWYTPCVTLEQAQWAKAFCLDNAHMLLKRFDMGEITSGNDSSDQQRCIISAFKWYLKADSLSPSYKISAEIHKAGFMPMRTLLTRAANAKAFKKMSTRTATQQVQQTIKDMIDMGIIAEVDGSAMASAGVTANYKMYVLVDHSMLDRE